MVATTIPTMEHLGT